MNHSIYEHLTPGLLKQLENKSDASKLGKINKIISHIDENSSDPEIIYAAGIGHFFRGEYEECMLTEESVYPLFNDEMGIAAIFWHSLAAWRCGKRPSLFEDHYHTAMLVGHHKSYNRIMALAAGVLSLPNARLMLDKEFRPLEYSIIGYGLYSWYLHIGEYKQAEELLPLLAANDDFWISYAYLAAYAEYNKLF